jgi:hypothetical protein
MTLNPYQSPVASSLATPRTKLGAWRSMLLLLLVGPWTISCWLGLLYAIYAWSTGLWSRYLSVGLILAIVLVWVLVVRRVREMRNVGAASLVACATTVLLLFVIGVGIIVVGANVPYSIFRKSTSEFTNGNWILVSAATFGATSGLIGVFEGHRKKNPMSLIVGGSCALICLAYLAGVVASLVFTYRLFS